MKKRHLVLTCIAWLISSASASADLALCNRTENETSVALAFRENHMWTSAGWWVIKPDTCKTIVKGELLKSPYFIHASQHDVGGTWQGSELFCVDKGSFTVKGRQNCEDRGFETKKFFDIESNGRSNLSLDLMPLANLPRPDLPPDEPAH